MTLRKLSIITSMLAVLAIFLIAASAPAHAAAVSIDKDKKGDNSMYVYSGKNFRATCVIDELLTPYYEATVKVDDPADLQKEINKYKKIAYSWIKKNTKKTHTYKITFKQQNKKTKKWKKAPGYSIKKTYKRKIKVSVNKKSSTKAVVLAEVSYTGRSETFFKTRKFKKNTYYVENNPDNEAFYFTRKGKFRWEPGEDENE